MLDLIFGNIGVVLGVIAGIVVLLIIMSGYVKAPTDKAYIISGFRKEPKILVGRSGIKIPFLERKDELTLKVIAIDVKTSNEVPTQDFINVRVDSNVNVQICTDVDTITDENGNKAELNYIKLASQNFLNQDEEYIIKVIREVLEGNVREIIGQMKLTALIQDRKTFAELVKENAAPDLAKLGVKILNFNVQDFTDGEGVINNLGIDHIVSIKKSAEISRANSERDIAQNKVKAEQEANDSKVDAETKIAERNNELALKKASLMLEAETARAKAEAAFEIEKENQRKHIETVTADADIEKQEKAAIVKEREALVREKELDAQVKKTADADLYAKQKQIEAKAFEDTKRADVKQYEAKKEYEILQAKAEAELVAETKKAEGIKAVGLAEAEAIKAKLLAEAEGLDKKAEAMAKMQEAAIIEMVVDKLPEMVANAAAPLAKVDSITMYGEGNSAKLVEDVMTSVDKVTKSLGFNPVEMFKDVLVGKTATKQGILEAGKVVQDAEVVDEVKSDVISDVIDEFLKK